MYLILHTVEESAHRGDVHVHRGGVLYYVHSVHIVYSEHPGGVLYTHFIFVTTITTAGCVKKFSQV